jgi:putative sterol carrier protein
VAGAVTAARLARRAVAAAPEPMLERAGASPRVLRALFGALARRFDVAAADGFAGDLHFAVAGRDGRVVDWTVAVRGDRAVASAGVPSPAALTVRVGAADLLRLAAGELDAGRAILAGRLDLEGDFDVATRVAAMFGLRSPI